MNMPTDNHVKKAFSLIENDTSKVLGLKIGDQSIQPGQYVTRQGVYILYFSNLYNLSSDRA